MERRWGGGEGRRGEGEGKGREGGKGEGERREGGREEGKGRREGGKEEGEGKERGEGEEGMRRGRRREGGKKEGEGIYIYIQLQHSNHTHQVKTCQWHKSSGNYRMGNRWRKGWGGDR